MLILKTFISIDIKCYKFVHVGGLKSQSKICFIFTAKLRRVPVLGGPKRDKLSAHVAFSTDPTVMWD